MSGVDVTVVVGTCAHERTDYAVRLAAATRRALFPSRRLATTTDPIGTAVSLLPWAQSSGAIVELPTTAPLDDFVTTAAHPSSACGVSSIICVADAMHLIDDLRSDTYAVTKLVPSDDPPGSMSREHTAVALFTARQLEGASTVVLVNWQGLATPNLTSLVALVSHLNPTAEVMLDADPLREPSGVPRDVDPARITAGWAALLQGRHRPPHTDRRIGALHYAQLRPFHPTRLRSLLDDRLDPREFGTVIRSAGFCRIATRASVLARWDHVGQVCSIEPTATPHAPETAVRLAATGQDLAFFGIDLRADALRIALDEAALTDAELTDGPLAWAAYADPFPAWKPAARPR
ncbi:hypothetical protein GCM10009847_18480 [Leucobacter tardus]|uniref:GTP-binding protein n=1 Tax=Leucobacter tardus TaxID=501483 RepID=A0A939QMW9_9MICO|nr:GTP-binding protein [Leucobacter tardus]MBO2990639.1 GTP-binding protein [Leucobacter tardus]